MRSPIIVNLLLVLPASGAEYADGAGNEFWTKGTDVAMLMLAGEAPQSCAAPKD